MQRSGCSMLTITTYNQGLAELKFKIQPLSWFRSASRSLLSTLMRASKDSACLPQHNTSSVCKASTVPNSSSPAHQRELYLMACMHRTQHHVNVNQDLLEGVTTDQQLFRFLKTQLKRYRGQFHSLLSMRRVQKIFFIKVSPTSSPACRQSN